MIRILLACLLVSSVGSAAERWLVTSSDDSAIHVAPDPELQGVLEQVLGDEAKSAGAVAVQYAELKKESLLARLSVPYPACDASCARQLARVAALDVAATVFVERSTAPLRARVTVFRGTTRELLETRVLGATEDELRGTVVAELRKLLSATAQPPAPELVPVRVHGPPQGDQPRGLIVRAVQGGRTLTCVSDGDTAPCEFRLALGPAEIHWGRMLLPLRLLTQGIAGRVDHDADLAAVSLSNTETIEVSGSGGDLLLGRGGSAGRALLWGTTALTAGLTGLAWARPETFASASEGQRSFRIMSTGALLTVGLLAAAMEVDPAPNRYVARKPFPVDDLPGATAQAGLPLTIHTLDKVDSLEVAIEAEGRVWRCPSLVHVDAPCHLQGLPEGPARMHVGRPTGNAVVALTLSREVRAIDLESSLASRRTLLAALGGTALGATLGTVFLSSRTTTVNRTAAVIGSYSIGGVFLILAGASAVALLRDDTGPRVSVSDEVPFFLHDPTRSGGLSLVGLDVGPSLDGSGAVVAGTWSF